MPISKRHRGGFTKTVGIAIALLLLSSFDPTGQCPGKPAKNQPNIILILTDDQGWVDTSVQMMKGRPDSKSDLYQTPHLERLARAGTVFSNAYAPAPVCSPSRNSILFGKTPARLHLSTLNGHAVNHQPENALPNMIKSVDPRYVTAHFGKWHIPKLTPQQAGYDQSDGPTGNGEGDKADDGKPLPPDDPKRTFSLSRRACRFLEQQAEAERPFFMQVSYYAVHVQNHAREETKTKYRELGRKNSCRKCQPRDFQLPGPQLNAGIVDYAAMVEDLDTGFGTILDKLEDLGIDNNTYVIFTSDNGGGFRGNAPLSKGKADLFEGGVRVPLVVRGPDVSRGAYCDVPVVGWDFYPTIIDLMDRTRSLPGDLDGTSLRPVLEQGNRGKIQRPDPALVFHFPWYDGEPESAIRLGNYKLVKNLDSRKLWLFDLAEDIGERNNLADRLPEKATQLHEAMQNYLAAVNAEKVQSLRAWWRKRVVEEYIPNQEKKIARLKAQEGTNDSKDLENTERYLNWLKEQVIFTDKRSRLHQE
jgi:arylsulfatase A-like enzyme